MQIITELYIVFALWIVSEILYYVALIRQNIKVGFVQASIRTMMWGGLFYMLYDHITSISNVFNMFMTWFNQIARVMGQGT